MEEVFLLLYQYVKWQKCPLEPSLGVGVIINMKDHRRLNSLSGSQ